MQTAAQRSGITFNVDDITPATSRLRECRMHEAVKATMGSIESCSDYHATVLDRLHYQPLLAAVYNAFSHHQPLVLTPDAVWLTIAQGVAHHMTIHSEEFRSRFVAHTGRLELAFFCEGWADGSPENPWPEAFASWTDSIRNHVGSQVYDTLVCDFSTTGPVERAASHVVMMDIFERYFHYVMYGICGIPTITLEGSPADWERLAAKAAALRVFELDWWLAHLSPICEQFVRASRGDVDLPHWQAICKLRYEYGGDIINGWVAKLFPYLRAFADGPCNRRNPIFETGEGFTTRAAPSGLSRVPFTWCDLKTSTKRRMEAIGGLVGVGQDPETFALRPMVGWAVREAEKLDVLLGRLANEHTTHPGAAVDARESRLPADLASFYCATDGAEFQGMMKTETCRILPASELERLEWGRVPDYLRDNDYPNGHIWYRLAVLPDNSWLAINPAPVEPKAEHGLEKRIKQLIDANSFAAICHCSAATQEQPGQNPVIALSFTELLERLLEDGKTYWQEPQFTSYGDAEEFTRRS
jgi:hypothetical protein